MKRLQRKDNWETILSEFIADRVESKLQWGKSDCASIACDMILSITGEDTAYWFRNKYSSPTMAYTLLKDFADGGLIEAIEKLTKEFNMKEWPSPAFAQRGDIVYSEIETCMGGVRGTLGFIGMNGSIVIPGKERLEFIPIEKGLRAWKV